MLRSEFEILTGIYVTDDLYNCIEQAYVQSKEDKRVFCENYKKNKDGLAQAIQQDACYQNMENRKAHEKDLEAQIAMVKDLQKEIKRLNEELRKEQGWETFENSAMDDNRYEALAKSGRVMTDEEAAQLVAEEFGFSKERIEVLHVIGVFERDKHNLRQRKFDAKKRDPLYDATDWNYVRFNVRGAGVTWMYEMVNGQLEPWSE